MKTLLIAILFIIEGSQLLLKAQVATSSQKGTIAEHAVANSMLRVTRCAMRSGLFVFVDECGPQMATDLGFKLDPKNLGQAIAEINEHSGYYIVKIDNGIFRAEPKMDSLKGKYLQIRIPNFDVSNQDFYAIIDKINKLSGTKLHLEPASHAAMFNKVTLSMKNASIEEILIQLARMNHILAISTGHYYDAKGNWATDAMIAVIL